MITLNDIINVLSDNKLTYEEKSGWMHSNNITNQDLIDAVNYVTIERNFYKRKCETTNNSEDVYAECRRMAAINTASVCENMTKIQKGLQKKGGNDE